MSFTGNEDHDITLAEASVMTKNYRDLQTTPGARLGGFFGAKKLLRILSQPDCVGIRYYYGLDANGEKTLILVGCDENENDIENGEIAEFSKPCPPRCGVSTLNS